MAPVAIKAEALGKRYQVGELHARYDTLRDQLARTAKRVATLKRARDERRDFWALQDVSFEINEGDIVGIIGHNGAGKTTLLKLLARITQPTEGRADVFGRVGSLLEVGTGFHPELTGRENIFLNGTILGMRRGEVRRKFDQIVEFAGVEAFIDTPVKRYSSGMAVRLAFSVAAHLEPEILLVDEALSVGDAEFQRKCLGKMEEVGRSGRTVVYVSHNMPSITRLCDRALLLERGRLVVDSSVEEAVGTYLASALGRSSHRVWAPEEAPGNENARLHSLRVVDPRGDTADVIDVREAVGIEYVFDVLRPTQLVPWLELLDEQESYVFGAFDTASRWREPAAPGRYTVTAWIPEHVLNEGTFSVTVSLRTFVAGTKATRHADARTVLTFQVYDRGEGDTSRGWYTGVFGGSVRPLLDWRVEAPGDAPAGRVPVSRTASQD